MNKGGRIGRYKVVTGSSKHHRWISENLQFAQVVKESTELHLRPQNEQMRMDEVWLFHLREYIFVVKTFA